MSYNHAIRLTLPYSDVSGIISVWADRSDKAIAYEHPADEEVAQTHVHVGLYGCEVKAEALKRLWKNVPGKGNEFWSWKGASDIDVEWCVNELNKSEADWDRSRLSIELKYLIYMAKGSLWPKFNKNFSKSIVEYSRQSWVELVKADKPSGDHSERIINKVISKIKSDFVYHDITEEERYDYRTETSAETLCKLVRSEAFRQLWGEHRRVPHASHYKIVAGSAFMRLCEHYGCFEQGLTIIQNLWY